MKKITVIICMGFISLLVSAQPGPFPPERMSDEEILQMQIKDIMSWLNMDKRTGAKFEKEYLAFRKEIDAIAGNAKSPQGIKDETDIDRAIQQNFMVSEQILQIRKKYYARFKEFMKPSQIQMMYRIENEAGRRMQGPPGAQGPGSPAPNGPGRDVPGFDGPRPDGPADNPMPRRAF